MKALSLTQPIPCKGKLRFFDPDIESQKPPNDCHECWISGNDNTDGMTCYILRREIKWFADRFKRPDDCPLSMKSNEQHW